MVLQTLTLLTLRLLVLLLVLGRGCCKLCRSSYNNRWWACRCCILHLNIPLCTRLQLLRLHLLLLLQLLWLHLLLQLLLLLHTKLLG
jgi:hypothetical protein